MNMEPKQIVLAYHEAFYRNGRTTVRALLANKGQFLGPISSYTDRDPFLDGAAVFRQLTKRTDIKAVVADGNDVCVVYDSTLAIDNVPVIPIASWFRVDARKITIVHTHSNPAPFIKAKESGDLARALEAIKKR